jgi:hypothetical protein
MIKDETIELARKAGFRVGPSRDGPDDVWGVGANLERLAKLIAEKEREFYMQLFLDPENQPTQFGTATQEYREQEIRAEREACANICEEEQGYKTAFCALKIRARGKNE